MIEVINTFLILQGSMLVILALLIAYHKHVLGRLRVSLQKERGEFEQFAQDSHKRMLDMLERLSVRSQSLHTLHVEVTEPTSSEGVET